MATAKIKTQGKTAVPKPMCDITDVTSIIYSVYDVTKAKILACENFRLQADHYLIGSIAGCFGGDECNIRQINP